MYNISVIGVGKAGLPLAAVIAESGLQVIGVGRNEKRIEKLNTGFNPIPEETGLGDLLKKNVPKNLTFTADPIDASKKSNVHILIVPLFIGEDKVPDFSNITEATEKVAVGLKKNDIIVLETTVPIGTTGSLVKDILEKKSGLKAGIDFHLAFSPERMMTGFAISRYKEVPKIVGGINEEATRKIADFYRHFCSTVVEVSSMETAEMTKISEGVYRDVNIALANELLKVAEKNNIDFWEVHAAAQTPACHLHEPGNVGGHCIPVYPWFLINSYETPLIKTARNLNDEMIQYYKSKVETIAQPPSNVVVVGLSFREGVKETAYTRSIPFIKSLIESGYKVTVYDPLYSSNEVEDYGFSPGEDFENADCIVVLNKYPSLNEKLNTYLDKTIFIKKNS